MATKNCKLVAYYRVSTRQQGASGLGLEGQAAAVAAHVAATGCDLVAAYTEVESGKRADRPELAKALAHAKRARATLVVAKLDRLSRNVAFLSALMESGVPFVACDNPQASPLTLHILAAVAEEELRAISARTKAALAAYKARGGLLGAARPSCRNLTDAARAKGSRAGGEATGAKARHAVADLLPTIRSLRDGGDSLARIAAALNDQGHATATGAKWSAVQVMRCLARA